MLFSVHEFEAINIHTSSTEPQSTFCLYITVTWASRIISNSVVCSSTCLGQNQRKHRRISHTKGQYYGKRFHVMTSSWNSLAPNGVRWLVVTVMYTQLNISNGGRKLSRYGVTSSANLKTIEEMFTYQAQCNLFLFPNFQVLTSSH